MTFERIGLGAILSFEEKTAVSAMGRAKQAFGELEQAVTHASMMTAPFTLALGGAFATAAQFEKAMGGVASVAGASSAELAQLKEKASQLGVSSVFSAKEVAEAMEGMARSGATTGEIMSGIGGILNAASAEGLGLAQSAEIVTTVINSMGLKMDDTDRVANVLALTSARTATSIAGLGESYTYAGAAAHAAGLSVEETTAMLGALGDAGLRGSTGGTHLTDMLERMEKQSARAKQYMHLLGISFKDANGNLKPMAEIMRDVNARISQVPGNANQAAVLTEIFGIRGVAAFHALAENLKKDDPAKHFDNLTIALGKAGDKIVEDGKEYAGAADMMAQKRLDNFLGRVKLFSSSVEQMAIEFFGPLLGAMTRGLDDFTQGFNDVLSSIQQLAKGEMSLTDITKKYGATAVSIAQGVRDAIGALKWVWGGLESAVRAVGKAIGLEIGGDTLRTITKFGILLAVAAGAVAPLLLGVAGLGFAITGVVVPAVTGLMTVGPLILEIGAGVGALAGIIALAYEGQIKPFIQGFAEMQEQLSPSLVTALSDTGSAVVSLGNVFAKLFGLIGGGTQDVKDRWKGVGALVSSVVSAVVDISTAPIRLIGRIADVIAAIVDSVQQLSINPLVRSLGLGEYLADEKPRATKVGKLTLEEVAQTTEGKANEKNKEPVIHIDQKQTTKVIATLDGKEVASATAKHNVELRERAGATATPYQRRLAIEQGAVVAGGT